MLSGNVSAGETGIKVYIIKDFGEPWLVCSSEALAEHICYWMNEHNKDEVEFVTQFRLSTFYITGKN